MNDAPVNAVMHHVLTQFCSLNIRSGIKKIKINAPNPTVYTIAYHHATLNFYFYINLLSYYMENANAENTELISYFTNLNPKPDLFIFQESQKFNIGKILGTDGQLLATIVYNKNLFYLVSRLNFSDSNYRITAWKIKCLIILCNPEIIVVSFTNSSDTDEKANIDNAKRCFKLLCHTFNKYPVLIAGGFNVELDTLKAEIHNFKIPECNPTIVRVLQVANKPNTQRKVICADFFTQIYC